MKSNHSVLKPAEIAARAAACIRQMTPDEALAYLLYREPGIPETDMNGDLLEMYRERREQHEAENRVVNKNAA